MFADSEETVIENSQEPLFASPVQQQQPQQASPSLQDYCCKGCKDNAKQLTTVLKELRELKESLAKKENDSPGIFVLENSPLEAPVIEFLKKTFPKKIFLGNPDSDLRTKVMSSILKYRCPHDTLVVLKTVNKAAARKFTDFRAQIKAKLLSKNSDIGMLDLPELGKRLFNKFAASTLDPEVLRTTVQLRCFCHENKLLPKQAGSSEPQDFWMEFQKFQLRVEADNDAEKHQKMQTREERRIERYSKL